MVDQEKKVPEVSVKLEDLIKVRKLLMDIRYPVVQFDEDIEVMKSLVIKDAKSKVITALPPTEPS